MVGGNSEIPINYTVGDIKRATHVVQTNIEERDVQSSNPALSLPSSKKPESQTQLSTASQFIKDGYDNSKDSPDTNIDPNNPLKKAIEATDLWISLNPNYELSGNEDLT